MADVFLSYASADRETAGQVAAALQAQGFTVWWDRTIPPGRQFDEVIEEALDAARCVVVLWSPTAAASTWVKTEAAEALRKDILVPALMDPEARIPLEFRRVQAADLSDWRPGEASPAFDQFCAAIGQVIGRPVPPAPAPRPRPPRPAPAPAPSPSPEPAPKRSKVKLAAWGVAGLIGLVIVVRLFENELPSPVVQPVLPLTGTTNPGATAGLDIPLQWRDYVLNFNGRLQWDGRTTLATLDARVTDSGNGRFLTEGRYTALVLRDAPQRMVFSTTVQVPGDSRTAGSHTHAVNLVFEQQAGGNWFFVRNCMAANRPDLCY